MSTITRLVAFGFGVAALAAAAGAVTPGPTVVVQYGEYDQRVVPAGDLALDSAAGQRALFQRVGFAIESMCGGANLANPHYSLTCSNEAHASVEPQLARMLGR